MLWRVRTTLEDRPGALATLARHCGERGANILGLQIFPDVGGVTDELVLRAPDHWALADVAGLIATAGGTAVTVVPCSEHALVDGPTRYLQAVLQLVRTPYDLPQIQDWLLAAGTEPTPTEQARAAAFAEVAEELLALHEGRRALPVAAPVTPAGPDGPPQVRLARLDDAAALGAMHQRCSADTIYRRYATPLPRMDDRLARRLLTGESGSVVAETGGQIVGAATVGAVEDGVAEVALLVEDGWQRRGVGIRLLATAARLARSRGAVDVVLRSRTHNAALTALAVGSGMRARIRLEGDTVVVTVGVEGLKPLATEPVPLAL